MGEVIAGRYELVDLLGSGGTGSVWRAWDHREHCWTAAKVLRHSDSDSVLRFVREARTVIEHDHVLVPRTWVAEDDKVLFTTDLVRGGSVATLLGDHGALPEEWVVELALQTARALEEVHRAGFVHRDVKPSNLLLDVTGTDRPRVWLGDFGIAAAVDGPRMTATHVVVGTPGYLAPEGYRGAGPDPRADLWALGALIRRMAGGETAPSRREESWDGPGPMPGSPQLRALVADLMAADVSDRPTSAAEVVARLEPLAPATWPDSEVEVFDQLPDLPTGWTAAGPVPRRRAAPGLVTHPGAESADADRTRVFEVSTTPVEGSTPGVPTAPRPGGQAPLLGPVLLLLLGVALVVLALLLA